MKEIKFKNITRGDKKLPTEPLKNKFKNGIYKNNATKEEKENLSMVFTKTGTNNRNPFKIAGLSENCEVAKFSEPNKTHSLIECVHDAFHYHLPITFSPDMIWQTILQGLTQHISIYPEEYRDLLVNFNGKKELSIFRPDLFLSDVEKIGGSVDSIVLAFQELIEQEIPENYFKFFNQEFSTTTFVNKISYGVSAMDCFSPYFDYHMYCGCGIPSIKIMGEKSDWQKIKRGIVEIKGEFYISKNINLSKWADRLLEVIEHFILSFDDQIDFDWWERIYKQFDMYLTFKFNGWIGWLFPYIKDGEELKENPMLNDLVDKEDWDVEKIDSFFPYIKNNEFLYTSDIPSGVSKANLLVTDIASGEKLDMLIIGGFFGYTQEEDLGLIPKIGYGLLY